MNKVTAITPVYGGEYVIETIESVLNQIVKPYDYCITTDGDNETCLKIFNYLESKGCELKDEQRYFSTELNGIIIKLKANAENMGIAHTLNTCIQMSEGDLICWLSADDCWTKDKLQEQLKVYNNQSNKENIILYTDYNLIQKDQLGIEQEFKSQIIDKKNQKNAVMQYCFINFSTTMIPRKLFQKVGLFYDKKRFGEDYEWLMRSVLGFDVECLLIQKPLLDYGVSSSQTTNKNLDKLTHNDRHSKAILSLYLELRGKEIEEIIEYFPRLK